jgi:hypothetical protein
LKPGSFTFDDRFQGSKRAVSSYGSQLDSMCATAPRLGAPERHQLCPQLRGVAAQNGLHTERIITHRQFTVHTERLTHNTDQFTRRTVYGTHRTVYTQHRAVYTQNSLRYTPNGLRTTQNGLHAEQFTHNAFNRCNSPHLARHEPLFVHPHVQSVCP